MAEMTRRRFRHLPVIEDGRLAGIVSIGDVVKSRLGEMELETVMLREASTEVLGREILYDEAALIEILSPTHFVEVRKTPGGPASSETLRASQVSLDALTRDREWMAERRSALQRASEELKRAAAAI